MHMVAELQSVYFAVVVLAGLLVGFVLFVIPYHRQADRHACMVTRTKTVT